MARFNRDVMNRLQTRWAPRVPPWSMLLHRGRRSGKEYRTPVFGWVAGGKLHVLLFYGEDSDWLRNVLAAGKAEVLRGGRRYTLHDPQLVDTATLTDLRPLLRRRAARALVGTLS